MARTDDERWTAVDYQTYYAGARPARRPRPLAYASAPPVPKPPPLPDTGLSGLLAHLQTLAAQHGWLGEHTYNADGPDQGLHVVLVREVVLIAEVKGPGQKLTPSQQRWLAALRHVGGTVEVHVWTTGDREAMTARLSRQMGQKGGGA